MEPNADLVQVLSTATEEQVQDLFDSGRVPRSILEHWRSVHHLKSEAQKRFAFGREKFQYRHDFDHVVLNLELTQFNTEFSTLVNRFNKRVVTMRDVLKGSIERHQLAARKLSVAEEDSEEENEIKSAMIALEADINRQFQKLKDAENLLAASLTDILEID